MVPTLEVNQRVLVDRVSFRFSDPERGDIVVFKPPRGRRPQHLRREQPGQPAVPEGDAGEVGHELHQAGGRRARGPAQRPPGCTSTSTGSRRMRAYASLSADCATCNLEKPITIPPDHYFMMGDNRGESADSREWGPVPKKWIIGKSLRHLLATQEDRHPLAPGERERERPYTARAQARPVAEAQRPPAVRLRPPVRPPLRRGRRRGRPRLPGGPAVRGRGSVRPRAADARRTGARSRA